MAIPSTMIPIPPSHCVALRQSRMPGSVASMSVSTVEPVVVKPDMDSKSAAAGERRVPENR